MNKIWSFRCKSCGRQSPYNEFRIPPVKKDGRVRPESLLAACPKCRSSDRYLYDDLELMDPVPRDAVLVEEEHRTGSAS